MTTTPDLARLLQGSHGLHVETMTRISAGTQTDNFQTVLHDGRRLFVKAYRPGADLTAEARSIAAGRHISRDVPVPAILRANDGSVFGDPRQPVTVWQWVDADPTDLPRTPRQAWQIGATLTRLHRGLARYPTTRWPRHKEKYRTTPVEQIRRQIDVLLAHIAGLPTPTAEDAANLRRLAVRREQVDHIPDLLAALPAPTYQGLHGDYQRPNLLTRDDDLVAVIDFRAGVGDPARELGRIAFDPYAVATCDDWLDLATATISGYLDAGGTMPAAQIAAGPRLALLHTLTSTYGAYEAYFDPDPWQADLNQYWANRCVTATRMLDRLSDIDDTLAALIRAGTATWATDSSPPADAGLQGRQGPSVIILVTGVSGAGKTTTAKRLQALDHAAISLDGYPDLCHWTDADNRITHRDPAPTLDWLRTHRWMWRPDVFADLVADARAMGGYWFLCGTAANQTDLFALCDLVIWLDIDRDTMRNRVTDPARGNPHGTVGDSLAYLVDTFDPAPPPGVGVVIDATQSTDTITDQLIDAATTLGDPDV